MQIQIGSTPMAKGVTHLTYVGADDGVSNAEGYKNFLASPTGQKMKIGMGIALAVAVFSKKHRKTALIAGVGIAALPFLTV